jgi:hypothetical protein
MKLNKLLLIGLFFVIFNQIVSENNLVDNAFDMALPSIPTPEGNMPVKPNFNGNKDNSMYNSSLEEFSNKVMEEVPGMMQKGTNSDNEKEKQLNEKTKLLESESRVYKGKGYLEPYREVNAEMPRFAQSEINFFGMHPNNHYELPSKFSVR